MRVRSLQSSVRDGPEDRFRCGPPAQASRLKDSKGTRCRRARPSWRSRQCSESGLAGSAQSILDGLTSSKLTSDRFALVNGCSSVDVCTSANAASRAGRAGHNRPVDVGAR